MSEKQRLNVEEAAAYVGMSKSWLNKSRMREGAGPTFLKVGKRRVVYDIADLDEWLAGSRRKSTLDREAPKVMAP
ncbi:MAG: helix-turn-helix domain-containing protein [Caulobacterales bacterium]|nr:helix-turn-helix domain-containing protein [Caulobacterales bacterium]